MAVRELSLFFPAHNEEESVAETVTAAKAAAERLSLTRYELVVVDDGSTDGTGPIADALSRDDPRIRVVHHPERRGYGAALRSGLAAARYEWVFWSDSDGQFDLGEIARLVAHSDSFDVIIGYRVRRADHVVRRINTFMWTVLVRTVFGLRVRDVDCAFKLMRRSWLDEIPALRCEGALVSTELLVRLEQAGARRRQIGVDHRPRRAGTPSGANWRVIATAFVEMLRERRAIGRARDRSGSRATQRAVAGLRGRG
jgi:glycosyltransferase involved in cell wall biosynthesis